MFELRFANIFVLSLGIQNDVMSFAPAYRMPKENRGDLKDPAKAST